MPRRASSRPSATCARARPASAAGLHATHTRAQGDLNLASELKYSQIVRLGECAPSAAAAAAAGSLSALSASARAQRRS
jgi:hypothetical protein